MAVPAEATRGAWSTRPTYKTKAARWTCERGTRAPSDATTGVAATAPAPTMVSIIPKPPGPRSNRGETSSAKTTLSIWIGSPTNPISPPAAKGHH